ncbi:hypothetical protein [Dactylosporangium sp. NPDC000521]|uniref:hypothetical protein n=1 Tax=Dactylosporangium sp. NPDC000521 TaxID=3363975 RepID=UPI0036B87031
MVVAVERSSWWLPGDGAAFWALSSVDGAAVSLSLPSMAARAAGGVACGGWPVGLDLGEGEAS